MRVAIGSLDVEVASLDLATGKQTAAPTRLSQRFSGPYHSWSGTIRERNLTSGDERVLSAPESGLGPISVSPDGVWIASTRPDTSTKSQTLILLPIQGGQPRALFRVSQPQSLHYSSMSWTPDGRAV